MLVCSFCPNAERVQLLGCCISFVCDDCLKVHSCSQPIKIIDTYDQISPRKYLPCCRCNRAQAIYSCDQCKSSHLCLQCSQLIHKDKYKLHKISPLVHNKVLSSKHIDSNTKRGFEGSAMKQNQRGRMISNEETETGSNETLILIHLNEMEKLKVDLEHKWIKYRLQVKSVLDRIRLELDRKGKEVMESMEREYWGEVKLVQKRIQEIRSSHKASVSLTALLQGNTQISKVAELTKAKRALFTKDSVRWNKALQLSPFAEYRINQQSTTSLLQLIQSFKLVQKCKIIREIPETLKSSIRQSSKSVRKPLKMESPRVTPKHNSRQSMIIEDCYGLNQSKVRTNQQNKDTKQKQRERSTSNSNFRKCYMSPRNIIVEKTNTSRSPGMNNDFNCNKRIVSKDNPSRSNDKTMPISNSALTLRIFK